MEEARAATMVAVNTYVREKEKSPNVQFIQQLRDKAMSGEANFMLWLGAYDATTIQWVDEAARNVSNTRTALRELLGMTRILRVGVTCMYNVRGRNAASVRRERLQHSQHPTVTAAVIRRMVARAGRPGKRIRAIRELNGRDKEKRRYTALPPSLNLSSGLHNTRGGEAREEVTAEAVVTDDGSVGMCSDGVTETNTVLLGNPQLAQGCYAADEDDRVVRAAARKNKRKHKPSREVQREGEYKRKEIDAKEVEEIRKNITQELPRCVLRRKIVTKCGKTTNKKSVDTRESPRFMLRRKVVTKCSVQFSNSTATHVDFMTNYDDDDDDDDDDVVTTNLICASSLCSSSAVAQCTANNGSVCDDDSSVNVCNVLTQSKVTAALGARPVRNAKRKRSNGVTARSCADRESKRRRERQQRNEVEAIGTRSILDFYDPVVVPAVVGSMELVRSPGGRGDRVGVGTGGGV